MFFRHAFDIFRGALVGQIIPIALMPVILRLYSPEEYGLFGSVMSLAIIFSTFMTLQLELAIVLPEDDKKAHVIAKTAFQISLLMVIVSVIISAAFIALIRLDSTFDHISWWFLVAPFIGFFQACVLICNYLSVRGRHFKDIGRAAATLQSVNGPASIGLGALNAGLAGLVVSRLLGQIAAVFAYRQAFLGLIRAYRVHGALTATHIRETLQENRKFAIFSTPYIFFSTLAREATPIILIAFNHPQAAGFYTIARMILLMPSGLLSTTIGQVFYKEASRSIHRPEFALFTFTLILGIMTVIAPGFAYIAKWGPDIFALLFGNEWSQAGTYALMLMPLCLVFAVNVLVGRVFEIANKQDKLFRMQIFFDGISLFVLVAGLAAGWAPLQAVGAYVACQTVYFLTFLAFTFRILRISFSRYAMVLGVAVFLVLSVFILHQALGLLGFGFWVRFAAETACVSLICLAFLISTIRRVQRNPLFLEGTPQA